MEKENRSLFILGSTGSIGKSTLECIRELNKTKQRRQVAGLAAGSNHKLLIKQIAEFSPKVVYIESSKGFAAVRKKFPKLKLFSGKEGICEALHAVRFDLLVNALVGSAGLVPTLEAVSAGADIALANKETLVAGGDLVKRAVKKKGVKLIPIDSEHAALLQLGKAIKKKELARMILTASGGPFFFNREHADPTPAQALAHPTWKMGKKISIDSATMINKGFEVIEARHLFDLDYDQIDVIIHPQSLIHSMIETVGGDIYTQMGPNDMRRPILNALTWPKIESSTFSRLQLSRIGEMTFFPPDFKRFPMLALAYKAGKTGGSMPAVLNAANEAAVSLFLAGKIGFHDIFKTVRQAVTAHTVIARPTLKQILDQDKKTKEEILTKADA